MKLELDQVTLRYGDKAPLLDGVSVMWESGAFVVLRGPSGCGKSSLLRLLNRLREPTAGRLLLDGRPFGSYEPTALRRRLAYLQQTPVMVAGTVRDNLLLSYGVRQAGVGERPPDDALRERLIALQLATVGLDEPASQLSVGQQQRLALLRLLLLEPVWLLADEPTSALDPESRRIVQETLRRLNRERGIGIVLVAHDEFQADGLPLHHYRFGAHGRLVEGEA